MNIYYAEWVELHSLILFDTVAWNKPCPCSSVVNALGRHVQLGPDASALYQRITANNSYTYDEQGDNPGQEKRAQRCPL